MSELVTSANQPLCWHPIHKMSRASYRGSLGWRLETRGRAVSQADAGVCQGWHPPGQASPWWQREHLWDPGHPRHCLAALTEVLLSAFIVSVCQCFLPLLSQSPTSGASESPQWGNVAQMFPGLGQSLAQSRHLTNTCRKNVHVKNYSQSPNLPTKCLWVYQPLLTWVAVGLLRAWSFHEPETKELFPQSWGRSGQDSREESELGTQVGPGAEREEGGG